METKVRALVIRSLGSTPTGLTPLKALVRLRIFSSLEALVGKRLGLMVWVDLCGTTWPLASILFNIRYIARVDTEGSRNPHFQNRFLNFDTFFICPNFVDWARGRRSRS